MQPLALAVLAAATPPDIDVVCYDDRLEIIPYDHCPDLVAISIEIFTARRGYEIADEYRRRGVTVILGGIHASLMPDEAAEHADCVVTGDAEQQWPQILDDFRARQLAARYDCGIAHSPQLELVPQRSIFAGKKYLPLSLIQYSRGCFGNCEFCASSAYFKQCCNYRNVTDVIAEIQALSPGQRRFLFFVDDNIVADKDAAKELFEALIPLKIHWVSQASMDMLEDAELMRLMVKSGCLGNVIGFESIGQNGIAQMSKTSNTNYISDCYKSAIADLRGYGLQTWAAFSVGHDDDTVDSILETAQFALKNKFCFAAFNILYPYPGTPLYQRLKQADRLLYDGKWWLHPEYHFNHATFEPAQMTADELTAVSFKCRQFFNSPSSIARRALEPHTNLRNPLRFFTYIAYNPLFRQEVYKKQDMQLGYDEQGKGTGQDLLGNQSMQSDQGLQDAQIKQIKLNKRGRQAAS
jgi:radical SAM superfamily enzyme YgiQ (UPF0313 family)